MCGGVDGAWKCYLVAAWWWWVLAGGWWVLGQLSVRKREVGPRPLNYLQVEEEELQ